MVCRTLVVVVVVDAEVEVKVLGLVEVVGDVGGGDDVVGVVVWVV